MEEEPVKKKSKSKRLNKARKFPASTTPTTAQSKSEPSSSPQLLSPMLSANTTSDGHDLETVEHGAAGVAAGTKEKEKELPLAPTQSSTPPLMDAPPEPPPLQRFKSTSIISLETSSSRGQNEIAVSFDTNVHLSTPVGGVSLPTPNEVESGLEKNEPTSQAVIQHLQVASYPPFGYFAPPHPPPPPIPFPLLPLSQNLQQFTTFTPHDPPHPHPHGFIPNVSAPPQSQFVSHYIDNNPQHQPIQFPSIPPPPHFVQPQHVFYDSNSFTPTTSINGQSNPTQPYQQNNVQPQQPPQPFFFPAPPLGPPQPNFGHPPPEMLEDVFTLPSSPPGSPTHCNVFNCFKLGRCTITPCGCLLCRDHLGTVLRGSPLTQDELVELGVADILDDESIPLKLFRCVACSRPSHTVATSSSPTSSPPKTSPKRASDQEIHHNPSLADTTTTFDEDMDDDDLFDTNGDGMLRNRASSLTTLGTSRASLLTRPSSSDMLLAISEKATFSVQFTPTGTLNGGASNGNGTLGVRSRASMASINAAPDYPPHIASSSSSIPLNPNPYLSNQQFYPQIQPEQQSQYFHQQDQQRRTRAFSSPAVTPLPHRSIGPPPPRVPQNLPHISRGLLSTAPLASDSFSEISQTLRHSASIPGPGPSKPPALGISHLDGKPYNSGRKFPILKIENIPFNTTVNDLEKWLPGGCLPAEVDVPSSVHLILHRGTGRTLPHCYLETVSLQAGSSIISTHDKKTLGDRTARVKWERRGELLRDLFSQWQYFSEPAPTYAAALLPATPSNQYELPEILFMQSDLDRMLDFCRFGSTSHRPRERPFLNIITFVSKFPWERPCWRDSDRDAIFDCAYQAIMIGVENIPKNALYNSLTRKLGATLLACPALTEAQKASVRVLQLEKYLDNPNDPGFNWDPEPELNYNGQPAADGQRNGDIQKKPWFRPPFPPMAPFTPPQHQNRLSSSSQPPPNFRRQQTYSLPPSPPNFRNDRFYDTRRRRHQTSLPPTPSSPTLGSADLATTPQPKVSVDDNAPGSLTPSSTSSPTSSQSLAGPTPPSTPTKKRGDHRPRPLASPTKTPQNPADSKIDGDQELSLNA